MKISRISPLTGEENELELDISLEEYEAWQYAGENDLKRFVQNAFPNLSAGEREFLISGITPTEWDLFLGDDE